MHINAENMKHRCSSSAEATADSHRFEPAETKRREEERKKRDDLWALGEGEPHGYPSLSGREGGEREKKGLDGGVRGAEGEGPNGAPNHVLHLKVILGVYVCVCKVSAKQMWGSEGKSGTLVCTQYSSCVRKNCGSIGGFVRKIQLPEWCFSMFVWMCVCLSNQGNRSEEKK